jgi:two-component system, NtrC family, response regulator HupR/HoxA
VNATDRSPPLPSVTALLVDDEPRSLDATRRSLEENFDVVSADQPRERMRRRPVDVIVCDQRMPGATGVQFLREVCVGGLTRCAS